MAAGGGVGYDSREDVMNLPAVIFEERLRIPSEVHRLAPFRLWSAGEDFPEEGRIDFLAGDVEGTLQNSCLSCGNRVASAAAISVRL